ncbi:MAG: Copper resistance protein CopB, partial [Variovorax sp.]|nr:Copper resistance protein CopB [Variovorax sp.]
MTNLVQHMKFLRSPYGRRVARPSILALAMVPCLVFAQSATAPMEGMDHDHMKGMDHDQMKRTAHNNQKKGMDHSQMKGMDHHQPKAKDHDQMKGMDHSQMKGMDHDQMKDMDHGQMKGMDHNQMKGIDHGQMKGMDHSQMKGMDHGQMKGMSADSLEGHDMDSMKSMQGGAAPPDARDPDAYADGLTHGPMPGMDMADNAKFGQLLIDRAEFTQSQDANGQALDAQAWWGGDIDQLWLKVDGERTAGRLGATRTEALWNHAISTYWGLQTGVRHDFGGGPGRTWAAFGMQGLAPYWFDVQATAYVGQGSRTAARVEAEYDILFTQRLILQPNVKVSLYGKNDPERGIGSGLSNIAAGLRLRFEISRKFAPYL